MQPSSKDMQEKVELRIRTIRTLWIALFLSVGIYYIFSVFAGQPKNVTPNTLSLIIFLVGLLTTLISIPIKRKFLTQSVEQQRVRLVQQGYIMTWAVTEVAALLGLLDLFLTANRYYYLLFLIAACGFLLHFPRRQDVINACFRNPTF